MSDRAHHTPFLVARPGNAARVICCDSCVGSRARLPAGVDTIDTEPEGELISAMCLMSSRIDVLVIGKDSLGQNGNLRVLRHLPCRWARCVTVPFC